MREKGERREKRSQGRGLVFSKHSVAVNLDGINELEQTTKKKKKEEKLLREGLLHQ